MEKHQLIQYHSINTKGVDYAVGDIHGQFDLVLQSMDCVNFDPSCDRLFSVGDLIDRGEGSYRAAKFLAQPYVFAVRGNHEEMLMEMHENGAPHPAAVEWMTLRNGFGWWNSATESQRQDVLDAARKLPLVREVETARGTVGMIHADVPAKMDWATFKERILSGCKKTTDICLWGRDRIEHGNEDGVAGIGRIFVGHTPQDMGVEKFGNVYAIDSGAAYGAAGKERGHLSMVQMNCSTGIIAAPKKITGLIDIRIDHVPNTNKFHVAGGLQAA